MLPNQGRVFQRNWLVPDLDGRFGEEPVLDGERLMPSAVCVQMSIRSAIENGGGKVGHGSGGMILLRAA
jgi:hypothetical protein